METNLDGQGEMSLTKAQCREIDRRATDAYGIPSIVLMENAGRGVVDFMCNVASSSADGAVGKRAADDAACEGIGRVVVLCGKGNNAGDGFVIARHLEIRGVNVRVFVLADPDELRGDAKTNYEILRRMSVPMDSVASRAGRGGDGKAGDVRSALDSFAAGADWLVDALLGTGATGEPREPIRSAIEWFNAQNAKKIAVDTPRGLDCDTGEAAGVCAIADYTCTFVAQKQGFDAKCAARFTGVVNVLDIGAPRELVEAVADA